MGSSNTNVSLYPSLENGSTRLTILSLSNERGEGRFWQRGIKTLKTEGLESFLNPLLLPSQELAIDLPV